MQLEKTYNMYDRKLKKFDLQKWFFFSGNPSSLLVNKILIHKRSFFAYPYSSYEIKIQMSDIKMVFLKYESGPYYATSKRKSTMLLIILKQQWLDATHLDKVSGDSLDSFFYCNYWRIIDDLFYSLLQWISGPWIIKVLKN